MTCWEYETLRTTKPLTNKQLNDWGAKGWALCSEVRDDNNCVLTRFMRLADRDDDTGYTPPPMLTAFDEPAGAAEGGRCKEN